MAAGIANVPVSNSPKRPPGWRGWLMLAPMVLWLLAFVVVPTGILAVYSFCQPGEGEMVHYSFTTEHYRRIFDPQEGYLKIFARSLGYAGLTTALCVVIGFPVAYYIGRASEAQRNRLLILLMVPFWTSFLIRTYAWITILSTNGLLNSFLQYTKLIEEPFEMLYTPDDLAQINYLSDIGFPGEFPYTRGIHNTMYRGKLWTMRQFAGFGTAIDTNQRYKFLLDRGQTGLSVAFDFPTLMGYDSDHPRSEGEVGKCGVAISSLADMETLFDGIPLGQQSVLGFRRGCPRTDQVWICPVHVGRDLLHRHRSRREVKTTRS